MTGRRLDELEVRYSLLEKTVGELSDVVWRQQQEIDELRELISELKDRVGEAPGLVDMGRVEKPPHF